MSTFQFPTAVGAQVFQSSAMSPAATQSMFQALLLQIFNIPVDPRNQDAAYRQIRCGWQQDGQPGWNITENMVGITAKMLNSGFARVRDQQNVVNDPISTTASLTLNSTTITVANPVGILPGLVVSASGIPANTVVWSVVGTAVTLSAAATVTVSNVAVSFGGTVTQQMSRTGDWNIHFTIYGPNAFDRANLLIASFSLPWVQDWLQFPPPPASSGFFFVADYSQPTYAPENFDGQWWPRYDVDLRFYELVLETIGVPFAETAEILITADSGATATINV